MIGTLMLPFHVTVVPQYIIFNSLGWINTFLPLIVPKFFAVDAFFIFLMVQFIRGIPLELEQAANGRRLQPVPDLHADHPAADDAGPGDDDDLHLHLDVQRLLLSAPVPQRRARTTRSSLGLRQFLDASGQSSWGAMFAMTTLSLVPVFVIFLFFQKRLVEGIATTGLKG